MKNILYIFSALVFINCGGTEQNQTDENEFFEDFGTHVLQFTSCHSLTNGEDLDATAKVSNVPSNEYWLILDNDTQTRLFLRRKEVNGTGVVWEDSASDFELVKHSNGSITYNLSNYECEV